MKNFIRHIGLIGLIGPIVASAANFSFTQPADVRVGDQLEVVISMDTEGERINAVQGTLNFPENLLEARSFDDGNSIINFWIERPGVEFAGAIPGGYLGKGKLFSVVFEAKSDGLATLDILDALALLNDGRGTPAKLTISRSQIAIGDFTPGSAPKVVERPEDKIPPAEFISEISQNPLVFDGKYFLVFGTQDKESGVDFYEVSEERGFWSWLVGPSRDKLQKAESPYELKDQELRSRIFVRAVDRAGNERIATLGPESVSTARRVLTIIFWIIVIALLILGGWRVLGRRF